METISLKNQDINLHEELDVTGSALALLQDNEDTDLETDFAATAYLLADEHRKLLRILQLLIAAGIITKEQVVQAGSLADLLA